MANELDSESAVSRARIAAHYAARAGAYDRFAEAAKGVDASLDREFLETLALWARAGVYATRRYALDCGCGTGRLAGALYEAAVPSLGIDLSPEMVRGAAAKHRKPPAALFAVGAVERLPFRDGTFGAVIDAFAFRHYESPEAAAGEWARVCAPRGTLVFADVLEKDADEEGLLTGLARAAAPGVFNVFYKTHEVEHFVEGAGFAIETATFYRATKTFAELDEELSAGRSEGLARRLVERAPPELRELYEVNEEGMVWRVLALRARRR